MTPGPAHLAAAVWLALAGAALAQAQTRPQASVQPASLSHHGFFINLSRIAAKENNATVIAAVKRQIEIVESVGLTPETLAFFRSVPIVLLPDSSGTPGLYSKRNKRVSLKYVDLAPTKPILLHKFLHAYHEQILQDGWQNADVAHFYEMALQRYRMSKSEYFLSNEKEFFAVTASIYLHGPIKRAPYNRQTIHNAQPLYWNFLEGLFGKRDL